MEPIKEKTEQLFTIETIDNSPFHLLHYENKFKIVLGMEIVSRDFGTKEEALKWVKSKPYELILNTCSVLTRHIIQLQKLPEKMPQ